MRYYINTPIWKTRSVGLAKDKMNSDVLEVEILYRDKQGKRIYPHVYEINKEQSLRYSTQRIKGHILYLIPIEDFKINEYREQTV